jgi:predicted GH43/DUF377 family glycosyl hydrolase
MNVRKSALKLYASSKAVIANFLHLPGTNRINNIISRVGELGESEVAQLYNEVKANFGKRHREIEEIFIKNFERVEADYKNDVAHFSTDRKRLLGAFFTKEYSIQAAALFNPSIVAHPDQTGLKANEQRFILSLRATGEGHISSIVFRTGIIDETGAVRLDEASAYHTPLKKNETALYSKDFIRQLLKSSTASGSTHLLNDLPQEFTAHEVLKKLHDNDASDDANPLLQELTSILDANYELEASSRPISEKVIFPAASIESMGMEDVRFVRFLNNENPIYYGTYTAYNGKAIQTQLIETTDFNSFKIRSLYGAAISDKGMALFPEKINGKYVMISRQGGEKISIMFSDDLYFWNDFQTLLEPQYAWEFVQLGNCGSPIKTKEGWLLLIHGVGALRKYVISAVLLDLSDPSKIKARLEKTLLQADETEREGYVPNVVYTCGFLQHNNFLIIPYAVSDSATGFATIALQELISEMKFM